VKLLGYVKHIDQLLAAIDLFVLPSLSEGLPISLLEAMAAGKPVLASAVGGILEVVENDDFGVLVPPADPSALAESIIKLFYSKDRMSNMANKAKSMVKEHFCSSKMAHQYLTIYSDLLS
jgi:glycosyltransferase involved in cell wall biosynthesis